MHRWMNISANNAKYWIYIQIPTFYASYPKFAYRERELFSSPSLVQIWGCYACLFHWVGCFTDTWYTVMDITKTYLRAYEYLKTEGPVPVGDYMNPYKCRLHLFVPKVFGNRKYHNLQISWQEIECRKQAYHHWIRINDRFWTIYRR